MADGLRARTGGSLPSADVADFLSAEPFALQQHTVAEVTRSLRDAGLPDEEWLQELRGMARDGSLPTFLLKVERHLAAKLRRREQEVLAELAIVQQQLYCDTLSARWWCYGIPWPLMTIAGLMYLLGLLAVDAVFDTHGSQGEVTAAAFSYYCTLLPSLWHWPQALRVGIAFVLIGVPLLTSACLSIIDGSRQQRRYHISTIILLGGPGIATFYLSIQSVQYLCAGPPPVAGASDFGMMLTLGEEMRFKHIAILSILLVAMALQLRTLASLSGRWPSLKHGQGVSHTNKHE